LLPFHVRADETYYFEGPFYDNREVVDGTVTVNLLYANNTLYSFNLVGDGITADNATIVSTEELIRAYWNASSTLNYTRTYDFTSDSDNFIDIHIPDPDLNAYVYYFTISDFYGMTTAYLETQTSSDNLNWRTVERKIIDQGTLSFVLTQNNRYYLMFTNDKGGGDFQYYMISYTPQSVFTMDLPILPGSFPTDSDSGVVATAIRENSTIIQVDYADSEGVTVWLNFLISHIESGVQVEDYSLNMTYTNEFSLTWNEADADYDYLVDIQSYRNGFLYEWKIVCGVVSETNPWADNLNFLGSWPDGVDPSQIIVSGIVLCFLCIGSVRTLGASCVISWIVGAIFLWMGWWGPAIPTFILAGVLSVLIAIAEGKETTREV
jgi:hypothetical protein